MSKIAIYGIKNCDTMKKAFQWFDSRKIAYAFHDYKKEGADKALLKKAIAAHGWEAVLNRKGTTWRALPDQVRAGMNDSRAIDAAIDNPSIIKRPLITQGGDVILGFDADDYAARF